MKKGFAASTLVIMVISISILVLGFILLTNVSKVTTSLPSPKQFSFLAFVTPEKAQTGTVFTIKAKIENVNRSDIYRINAQITKDNASLAGIPLFDDGLHGDDHSNDGIYANTFDSAKYGEGVYYVNIEINPVENEEVYRNTASFQIFNKNCINLKYNGDPSQKVDVVFVPSDYKDMNKFMNDVIKYIDFSGRNKGLLSMEPLKSGADKFNFYLVNQSNDLQCNLNCAGISSMICCNDNKVSETASQCPADQIIVLKDINTFCGTASYYAKVCTISRGAEVLTHEFGHSFGGLGDEYDYSSTYPTYNAAAYNYPNCDQEGCPKWSNLNLENTGCYKGCGISNAYRATPSDCIMYTYVNKYCPVDIINVKKLLDNYSPQKTEGLAAPPIEKSYLVNLNYNKGSLSLNDVYVTETTAPDRNIARKSDYKAKLISFTGETVYTFNIEIPRTENPSPSFDNLTYRPSPVVFDNVDRMITVPYFNNVQRMEVYDNASKKVLDVNLGYFSNTCGNGVCEPSENSAQCSEDCKELSKDNLCTYAGDGICDPDCITIDPDCRRLSPLMIANAIALSFLIALLIILVNKKK